MDPDEKAQREAEHRAAALHHLGPQNGAGATVWARGVRELLVVHEAARERYAAGTPSLDMWEQLHVTALLLTVAIDQVLAFERRVCELTEDAELRRARARFDSVCPHADSLRDVVSHLDAYAIGEGWRQTGRRLPPITENYLGPLLFWGNGGSTMLELAGERMELRAAAEAAADLARVVETVRARHLQRISEKADAAMRRRYGLDSHGE